MKGTNILNDKAKVTKQKWGTLVDTNKSGKAGVHKRHGLKGKNNTRTKERGKERGKKERKKRGEEMWLYSLS